MVPEKSKLRHSEVVAGKGRADNNKEKEKINKKKERKKLRQKRKEWQTAEAVVRLEVAVGVARSRSLAVPRSALGKQRCSGEAGGGQLDYLMQVVSRSIRATPG